MALKKTNTTVNVVLPSTSSSKHITGDPAMAVVVDQFLAAQQRFDTAKGDLDTYKSELADAGFEAWLKAKGAASTVTFEGTTGELVNVSCKDQYSAFPEENLDAVTAIIGEEAAEQLLSYEETLAVDVSLISEAKRAEFVARVQAVAREMGISDAVLAIKQRPRPIKDLFHKLRHSILTVPQNRALNAVIKTVVSVAASAKKSK